ncbi:MAG: glycosyltransferase [Candidatus Edwardsbacteria bacterium]|nr:glycosyltransferase [Candidatus Edwardsbacteria bacterium]
MIVRQRPLPTLSVVMPTLNRPGTAGAALGSLLAQTCRRFEIVVIDQSDRPIGDQLSRRAAAWPRVRYCHIPRCGSPRARNYGVALARGEIILSIDDDIIACPALVAAHLANYADPAVGAVAGRVTTPYDILVGPHHPIGTFDRRTGNMATNFNAERRTFVDHAYGCNFSFRRAAFAAAGGFDERFVASGMFEETDLGLAIGRAGYRIVFDPAASAEHRLAGGGGNRTTLRRMVYWRFHNYVLLCAKHLGRQHRTRFIAARLREAAGWAKGEREGSLLAAGLLGLWRGLARAPGEWRD